MQEARCTGFLTGEAGSTLRAGDPQSLNRENELHVQWLPGSRPEPTPRTAICSFRAGNTNTDNSGKGGSASNLDSEAACLVGVTSAWDMLPGRGRKCLVV